MGGQHPQNAGATKKEQRPECYEINQGWTPSWWPWTLGFLRAGSGQSQPLERWWGGSGDVAQSLLRALSAGRKATASAAGSGLFRTSRVLLFRRLASQQDPTTGSDFPSVYLRPLPWTGQFPSSMPYGKGVGPKRWDHTHLRQAYHCEMKGRWMQDTFLSIN